MELSLRRLPAASRMRSGRTAASDDRGKPVSRPSTETAKNEQQSAQFKERMHQRNAIEGTVSELARAHGLRRSRYRGFAKVELQNLLIATACNIKRWLRAIVQSFSSSAHALFASLRILS